MLYKSRGVVLKSIRYKETDLITKIFTLEHGVLSFHIRGVLKSKRNNLKSAFFLPFNILSIDYNYRDSKSLQYLKEVKQDSTLNTIHFEISKNAIVVFLTEVLSTILPEKEKDKKLFSFLEKKIQTLDKSKEVPIFIHQFLIELTTFLGCPPDKKCIEFPFFNLVEGTFTLTRVHQEFIIEIPEINLFKELLGTKFDASLSSYPKLVRQQLLYRLLKYYHLHVNGFKEPKSLTVLEEVFS